MNNYHFQSNIDPTHGGESFEPSYFHAPPPPYYPPPPPLPQPQSYYPSSHSAPRPPPPHIDTTSSSDDSPHRGHHQAFPPPMFQNPYATSLPTTHSDTQSSSFESHGSSHGVPPFVGFAPSSHHPYHPAMMAPPPGYPHYYPWAAPPIEYITNIQPSDVLSGRGGATNSHSGNRAFRALVKSFQDRYLRVKKRDKPSVAAEVVQIVRNKGGRFLRRCETPSPHGEALYYDIGDRRATEKVCQCLRENAPQIRAKRRVSKGFTASSSEVDDKLDSSESSPHDQKEATLTSSSSSFERLTDEKEHRAQLKRGGDSGFGAQNFPGEELIVIEPSARLLRRSKVDPISLNDLTASERELYLRDFLPPNHTFRKSESKPQATLKPNAYEPGEYPPVVSV